MTTTACETTPTAYALAEIAGMCAPDSLTSPGAAFLVGIWDHVRDNRDEGEDAAAYIADAAVPIYTSDLFAVLVDLAAYREDTSDFGPVEDMTAAASRALYLVAERLTSALLDERR